MWGCPGGSAGVPAGCAARRSRHCAACRLITTAASSSSAAAARRSRCWPPSPAACTCPWMSATTCSAWPGTPRRPASCAWSTSTPASCACSTGCRTRRPRSSPASARPCCRPRRPSRCSATRPPTLAPNAAWSTAGSPGPTPARSTRARTMRCTAGPSPPTCGQQSPATAASAQLPIMAVISSTVRTRVMRGKMWSQK